MARIEPAPPGAFPTFTFTHKDRVTKRSGAKFTGVVVSIFWTTTGKERVVVEADHADYAGLLHIYAPEQLMRIPPKPEPPRHRGEFWPG
jgi:hypothetical protein